MALDLFVNAAPLWTYLLDLWIGVETPHLYGRIFWIFGTLLLNAAPLSHIFWIFGSFLKRRTSMSELKRRTSMDISLGSLDLF